MVLKNKVAVICQSLTGMPGFLSSGKEYISVD
jgi:hypothetical protein